MSNSELNNIIQPEIKNDAFYAAIQKIVKEENIKTVLEIGSSSGEGSTEAFVRGIRENPNKPMLFCLEISTTRFAELQKRYANETFVKCYNLSSVSLEDFPDENEVVQFYNITHSNLNYYPLERVLGWLRQDIEYVRNAGVPDNGIQKIKEENNIDFFDAVLIDGSEFTGSVELEVVYGAYFIFLDDINTFKNYKNHQELLLDKNYQLLSQNKTIRNGYSIFKRVNKVDLFDFEHEKAEQLLVKNLIGSGMIVFDIGANRGDYSFLLSKLVGNSGKVYSFEPTSSTFQKLQARIDKSEVSNIYAFQKAIFSENTRIEFNEFPEEYSVWNSIGKPQMLDPKGLNTYVPIVKTEIVEAITVDSFCQEQGIEKIDYLKIDVEGAESDVIQGASNLLTKKAIRFLQFEISKKMLEGLNRKAKDTFDILIKNGYECHRIENNGKIGQQVDDSEAFYENFLAFPELPVHFFTIVLNGQPFIRYHIDVFKQLPFKWHWHIIEGVADLKHDTSWSLKLGGNITNEIHHKGRSKDGTTEYLDELALLYPENITVYRQPEGVFWDGKREMVNAPLGNIHEECLLWQVDVDELWTLEQLCNGRQMFIEHPEKTAAFYWCWYFVGENLVISTRNCYTQNPQQEWLRTWRFKPGAVWAAHEPPILVEHLPDAQWRNVAAVNPFLHQETEARKLIFQHFAYVTPSQLRFKEQYYGYKNAVSQWVTLQKQDKFPVLLRQYFPWVRDETMVDTVEACGVLPIAQTGKDGKDWQFLPLDEQQKQSIKLQSVYPSILVDSVFFQFYRTGIARVWESLLEEWIDNGFSKHIVVLDRAGTAPKIPGIRYRLVPPYDYNKIEIDHEMLQQVCDAERADLFISTYYTTPLSTPSVFMAYDMIPEVLGGNLDSPMWREKHHGIQHASAYIAISENTARDLIKFFPHISPEAVTVAHCGVGANFFPASLEEVNHIKTKYGISKPYFMMVGAGSGYKNTILFFKAFAQLYTRNGFDIVCTGSGSLLEPEMRAYTSGSAVYMLQLSDEELRAAYSGAVALVYPSLYEGFGLPVLEAIACGCPVITCPNASIPEVAGEAALYVNDDDVEGLANALCEIQKPLVRQSLVLAGHEQAKKFSWSKMAQIASSALIDATLLPLKLRDVNLIIFPDWTTSEESIYLEMERVIRAISTHPDRSHITLLVDTSGISQEEANLFLSGVAMNLLMQEDLDVTEGAEISFVAQLGELQWQALLPRIQARVVLEKENEEAIAQAKAQELPSYGVDSLIT
jgi:FkbM family methyltransferase